MPDCTLGLWSSQHLHQYGSQLRPSGCLPQGVNESQEAPATLYGAAGHQSDTGPAVHTGPALLFELTLCHPVRDVSKATMLLQGMSEVGTLPSWALT